MVRAREPLVRENPRETMMPARVRDPVRDKQEQMQNASCTRDRIIRYSATDQRALQHVEVDQRAPRSTPARATKAQRMIADVHVEAYLSLD